MGVSRVVDSTGLTPPMAPQVTLTLTASTGNPTAAPPSQALCPAPAGSHCTERVTVNGTPSMRSG